MRKIRMCVSVDKTLMRFFMKCKYLPFFEIALPKADKAPIQTHTDDELRKLLKKEYQALSNRINIISEEDLEVFAYGLSRINRMWGRQKHLDRGIERPL